MNPRLHLANKEQRGQSRLAACSRGNACCAPKFKRFGLARMEVHDVPLERRLVTEAVEPLVLLIVVGRPQRVLGEGMENVEQGGGQRRRVQCVE